MIWNGRELNCQSKSWRILKMRRKHWTKSCPDFSNIPLTIILPPPYGINGSVFHFVFRKLIAMTHTIAPRKSQAPSNFWTHWHSEPNIPSLPMASGAGGRRCPATIYPCPLFHPDPAKLWLGERPDRQLRGNCVIVHSPF